MGAVDRMKTNDRNKWWRGAARTAAAALWAWGAAAAWGREAVLTVLHTTDIHGAFMRGEDGREGRDGGLAECAGIIKRIRAENPCCVALDGGDFAVGTASSWRSKGLRMAEALGVAGYDAVALGNHEFDWGVEQAGAMAEALRVPLLAANLKAGPGAPEGFRKVLPYIVKDVEGVRVAVIGVTTPNLPNWFRDFRAGGLDTESAVAALERVLPEVKAREPDVIVVLAHQGLLVKDDESNEINAIGATFPEIDLLLGGHLHWVQPGALVGKVDYAQSGSGGRGVTRVDLTVDTVSKKVTRKRFEYIPVTKDTAADGGIAALTRADREWAEGELSKVLARAPRGLAATQAGGGLSPAQQFVAKAVRDATGADAVMQGVGSGGRLAAGEVTVREVWRMMPYENRVGVVWLTPEELRGAMEDNMEFWGTERYVPVSGIGYDLYPNAPRGERVRNLRWEDGRAINGRRRIAVAANSYMLAGGGGRFPRLAEAAGRPESRLKWAGKGLREIIADEAKRLGTLEFPPGEDARIFLRERRTYERIEAFENAIE